MSLLAEYCRKPSLFVIWILFKIIWEIEERSEFRQHHCRNSEKKVRERGERSDVMEVGERKKKFWQWYCRNSFLSSFPQINLNNTHITNKLGFLQYSTKRLDRKSVV